MLQQFLVPTDSAIERPHNRLCYKTKAVWFKSDNSVMSFVHVMFVFILTVLSISINLQCTKAICVNRAQISTIEVCKNGPDS